jgi:hypothetical protein
MAITYEPIATQTLGSASGTVTFSSISGSYTDIICQANFGTSATTNVKMRINSDSASNYSLTYIDGNGTTAVSGRTSSSTAIYFTASSWYAATGFSNILSVNLMNYSNTTTNKTILTRYGSASAGTLAFAGLWRSTSAINALEFTTDGSETFSTGSTFTLYGIKAA